MPAQRGTTKLQDQHDNCEDYFWRCLDDGHVDETEREGMRTRFRLVRGGIASADGVFRLFGVLSQTAAVTPWVERTFREVASDASRIVAFPVRDDGGSGEAA